MTLPGLGALVFWIAATANPESTLGKALMLLAALLALAIALEACLILAGSQLDTPDRQAKPTSDRRPGANGDRPGSTPTVEGSLSALLGRIGPSARRIGLGVTIAALLGWAAWTVKAEPEFARALMWLAPSLVLAYTAWVVLMPSRVWTDVRRLMLTSGTAFAAGVGRLARGGRRALSAVAQILAGGGRAAARPLLALLGLVWLATRALGHALLIALSAVGRTLWLGIRLLALVARAFSPPLRAALRLVGFCLRGVRTLLVLTLASLATAVLAVATVVGGAWSRAGFYSGIAAQSLFGLLGGLIRVIRVVGSLIARPFVVLALTAVRALRLLLGAVALLLRATTGAGRLAFHGLRVVAVVVAIPLVAVGWRLALALIWMLDLIGRALLPLMRVLLVLPVKALYLVLRAVLPPIGRALHSILRAALVGARAGLRGAQVVASAAIPPLAAYGRFTRIALFRLLSVVGKALSHSLSLVGKVLVLCLRDGVAAARLVLFAIALPFVLAARVLMRVGRAVVPPLMTLLAPAGQLVWRTLAFLLKLPGLALHSARAGLDRVASPLAATLAPAHAGASRSIERIHTRVVSSRRQIDPIGWIQSPTGIVAGLITVGVLGAVLLWPSGTPTTCATAPADTGTVKVVHWAAGHTFDLLTEIAVDYNAAGRTISNGKRIEICPVELVSVDQVEMLVEAVRVGRVANPEFGEPTIANPTVDFWLVELNYRAGHEVIDQANTKQVAVAWTGIATYPAMAACLGWPDKEIGYSNIVELLDDPRGWAACPTAKAAWGQEPLMSWTDPGTSGTARSVLFALYSVASEKPTDQLTVADIQDRRSVEYVRRFQQKVDHYVPGTLLLQTKMALGYSHLYWVAEDVVVEVNDALRQNTVLGAPKGTRIHPLASKGLVFIYLKEGSIPQNQPAGVVQAPWVDAEEAEAARLWIDYLLEPARQQKFLRDGFRPAIPMQLQCPICPDYGLDPAKPTRVLAPVRPEVASAIVSAWGEVKKPGIATFVVDVSGSMRGGKLTQAREGLLRALNGLASNTSVGLLTFSTAIVTTVPIGPIAANRQPMADAIGAMEASGETGLYDAIAEAIRMTDAAPGDAESIRGVVVLTDGEANSGSTTLYDVVTMTSTSELPIEAFDGFEGTKGGLERGGRRVPITDIVGAALRQPTTHQIHVCVVAVGDANPEIGRVLAEATRCSYQKTTEAGLAGVLETFGKYF